MSCTGTAGLAESNGSLLPGLWRDSLHVTCGLTACTPGSAPGSAPGPTSMGKLYLFNLVIDNPPHINYVTTVPCNLLLIRPTSLVCGGRTFSDIHVPRGSDIV